MTGDVFLSILSVSLEGALGKISIRSRSAPRPLLQVSSSHPQPEAADGHKKTESVGGYASLPLPLDTTASSASANDQRPLTRRQALIQIEHLYDIILELEQLRRIQPQVYALAANNAAATGDLGNDEGEWKEADAQRELRQWEQRYNALLEDLWTSLKVGVPLDHRSVCLSLCFCDSSESASFSLKSDGAALF
jgi:DNA topoisomerase 2-associated protein PAT1